MGSKNRNVVHKNKVCHIAKEKKLFYFDISHKQYIINVPQNFEGVSKLRIYLR